VKKTLRLFKLGLGSAGKGQPSALQTKYLSCLPITDLQVGRGSVVSYSLPLVPVFYQGVLSFLATYWPFGKIGSRVAWIVNVWRIECYWWSSGDSNPGPPHCERGALPTELLPHREENTVSSFGFQVWSFAFSKDSPQITQITQITQTTQISGQ
jgi:hypothetical protein